jgi:catechol 2,3-dioxygenase-like lactoylglutathione lyase family enzyme
MRAAGDYMVLHVDFFVRSMQRSLEFYCDRLGFSVVDETLLRGAIVHSISSGAYDEVKLLLLRASPLGAMIELLELQEDSATDSNAPRAPLATGAVSILVPDLEAHISRAKAKGVDPVSDVFTVDLPQRGCCRLVFYEDPDGNRLEFIQRG